MPFIIQWEFKTKTNQKLPCNPYSKLHSCSLNRLSPTVPKGKARTGEQMWLTQLFHSYPPTGVLHRLGSVVLRPFVQHTFTQCHPIASSDDKSQDPTPTLKGLRDQMGERSKPAIAIQQKKRQVRAHTPKDNACVHGKPSVSTTIAVTLIIIPVIKDLGAGVPGWHRG